MRRGQTGNELLFGSIIAGTILSVAMIAAFNGGISLKTGEMEMRFDASMAQGLHITFASAKH
ncbi:MAG: hypothetical protein AAGK23_02635 [Pseudomonadota bacterium]